MGDLKVAETFQDAVFITSNATGLGVAALVPTCTFVKIADGTRTVGTVQDVGFGWYRVTDFTNDAAGSWTTEWAVVGAYTIHGKVKEFKVGAGRLEDVYTRIGAPAGASIAADLVVIDNFVDGIEADIGVFPTANYATIAAYVEDIRTRLITIVADTGTIVWGDITGIVADIGVFPTANYATLAAYVEDVRTRLTAIVGDTNELQVSLADGGFTDLLIDAIKAKTDNLPVDPADASDIAAAHALLATEAKQDIIDTNVDDIEADTNEIQTSLADGGFTDLLIDAIKAKTDTIVWGDITTLDTLIDGIVADIGVFPTANYATFAAYVEDIRSRLIVILADTNELQTDDIPGKIATLEGKVDTIDGIVDDILTDTGTTLENRQDAMHSLLVEGQLRTFRRTYAFVSTSESVSNAAEVSLAAPAVVTVNFPTGATLLEAKVVAAIKANNQTAAEHNIGITLQKNVAAGGWVDIRDFTANPPLTLPEVDATADGLTLVEALTITTGQTVQFRWQVDSDNAGEVHYVQTFVLSVEYDFQ